MGGSAAYVLSVNERGKEEDDQVGSLGRLGLPWALAACFIFFYRNTITPKTNKYKFKNFQKIHIVIWSYI